MTTILFFDDQRLSLWDNVTRKIGRPNLIRESVYQDPNANAAWGYPAVFHDQESGKWRMIYEGYLPMPGQIGTLDYPVALLAESDDGLRWEPRDTTSELDLPERLVPNQLLPVKQFDAWPACYVDVRAEPAKRIKGLVGVIDRSQHRISTSLWTSPDGLHWHQEGGVQWQKRGPDPGIGVFWNDVRQSYVLTTRADWTDRRIAVCETRDWQHFTEPELALQADALDAPLTEPYAMPVFPYEGHYVGLLWLYHPVSYIVTYSPHTSWDGAGTRAGQPPPHSPNKFYDGPVDCQLTYSLNGWHFQRTLREAFIPTGEPGEPDAGCVYPSYVIQQEDGSLLIYASACTHEHGYIPPGSGSLLAYRLRRDGFVYLESVSGIGTVGTRNLYWRGGELELNVQGPSGEVRAQVTDARGAPLEGYAFSECVPFSGDSTSWQPRWQGGKSLAALSEKIVRVEVALRHSRIYAIRGDFVPLIGIEVRRFESNAEVPEPRPGF